MEQKKSGRRKWLSIGGSVVAVGIVGAGALGLGSGDPEVGDCVQLSSDTEFDVVDCGAGEAEYKIVGIAAEDITYPDYMADDDPLLDRRRHRGGPLVRGGRRPRHRLLRRGSLTPEKNLVPGCRSG